MKIELDEKDIEIILLHHIQSSYPESPWEIKLDKYSYSGLKAEFSKKETKKEISESSERKEESGMPLVYQEPI